MLINHAIPLTDEISQLGPKPRGTPERTVQISLRAYMRRVLPGCMVAAVKNEHAPKSATKKQRQGFFQKRTAEGVKSGFPDLIVTLPERRVFFVEVKAPKNGVVSGKQDAVHGELQRQGHTVIVADSIESLRFGLHEAGIVTREAPGGEMHPAKVRRAKAKLVNDEMPI